MPEGLELLLYFVAFYGIQCSRFIPVQSQAYVRSPFRSRYRVGGGPRLLGVWPGERTVVASRLPFSLREGELCAETPTGRIGLVHDVYPACHPLETALHADVVGSVVRIETRRFVRAASTAEARQLVSLMAALSGGSDQAAREEILREAIRSSLAVDALEKCVTAVAGATRSLRWSATLYLLLVVAAGLAASVPSLAGTLLPATLAMLVGIHVLTVWALWRAHARLDPEGRAKRAEFVLAGALFPPGLLSASQKLWIEGVPGFHPVAVAHVMLEGGGSREVLRRELAAATWPQGRDESTPAEGKEAVAWRVLREELERFAQRRGFAIDELLAHTPSDPDAARYCPLCHAEFTEWGLDCAGCEVATLTVEADAPSSRAIAGRAAG